MTLNTRGLLKKCLQFSVFILTIIKNNTKRNFGGKNKRIGRNPWQEKINLTKRK